jgi:hypothetical protein
MRNPSLDGWDRADRRKLSFYGDCSVKTIAGRENVLFEQKLKIMRRLTFSTVPLIGALTTDNRQPNTEH